MLFFDIVFLCISCKDQGQGTVACYVAGCTKAVLKSKDSKHQSCSCFIEAKDTGDDTK